MKIRRAPKETREEKKKCINKGSVKLEEDQKQEIKEAAKKPG